MSQSSIFAYIGGVVGFILAVLLKCSTVLAIILVFVGMGVGAILPSLVNTKAIGKKHYIIIGVVLGLIVLGYCFFSSGSFFGSKDKDSYGHDKFDAFAVAEKIVKNNLKAPSTAKFCSASKATITRSDNTWTVSGWVEAQNSFGATLRNNFTVKITFSSSDRYAIEYCNIS